MGDKFYLSFTLGLIHDRHAMYEEYEDDDDEETYDEEEEDRQIDR